MTRSSPAVDYKNLFRINKVLRVLLVDNNEDDYIVIRKLISKITGSHFKLSWVATAEEASDLIKKREHDIYLVDYRLGKQNGIRLLTGFDLVQRPEPFIVLANADDERVEQQAMKIGAADYLVKGTFDGELLSRVMRYSMQRKQLESQRMQQLIELNRSKDEFIALASHQLRTPATAVKQYVGMVLQGYAGDVTEQQKQFLRSAYESNERQINVVNDILRVAQLDLKRMVLNKTSTNIPELVDGTLRDASSVFKSREQIIKYSPHVKPIRARVDREQIRMAIGNMIDNASKYTPRGKQIAITVKEARGKKVSIVIEDQGVGIGKEDLEKLFKKFSRVHNPLSVEVGGSGLGLYWAHEVIQLHEGKINVTSTLGKGTKFTISLPR